MDKIKTKNKLKFYRFLKKNIKGYNKKIREFYLHTLKEQTKLFRNNTENQNTWFVIPPIYTKDKKFDLYIYEYIKKDNKIIIIL